MPDGGRSTSTGRATTVLGVLAVGPVVTAACLVVTMKVAIRLGVGVVPAAWATIATVLLLLVSGFAPKRWREGVPRRPTLPEMLILLGLVALFILFWDRVADRSLVWPHTFGVDQAHHGSLVTWLVDERRLPVNDARLSGLGSYPIGVHLVAAAVTIASGTTPITGMWWTALGIIAAQVLAIVWLVRTCSPRQSLIGAPIAVAVWAGAWQFGIGSLTVSFFFSQALGVTFCLVGVGLAMLGGSGAALRRWLPAAVVLAVATAWTYPQHAITVPACAGMVLALQVRRWFVGLAGPKRKLVGAAMVLAGAAVVWGAWSASRNSVYLTRGAFFGNGEGGVPALSIAHFGGILVATLMAIGVIEVAIGARHRREPLVLLVGIIAPIGLGALLAIGRALGWGVTKYRIIKNAYLAMPLLAVAVGVVIAVAVHSIVIARLQNSLATQSPRTSRGYEVGGVGIAAALMIMVVGSLGPLRFSPDPIMDRDSYRLARIVARTTDPETIGIAGEGLSPYGIWWTGLRRKAPGNQIVVPRMEFWREWPEGPTTERFLIVDSTVFNDFASRSGVRVAARFGTAALLERETPAPTS